MIWKQINYRWIQKTHFKEIWNYNHKGKIFALVGFFSLLAGIVVFIQFSDKIILLPALQRDILNYINALLFVTPLCVLVYWRFVYLSIYSQKMNAFSKDNSQYFKKFAEITPSQKKGILFRDVDASHLLVAREFTGEIHLPFILGNFWFVRRSVGYIRFTLPRRLPNMVLDAKANNKMFKSSLPAYIQKDQVMSLEGDFSKYYTVYVPKKYERDALYIFTPDIMELLIETGAQYDVEIVDDSLYVYSNKRFRFDSVEFMKEIIWLIEALSEKFSRRVDAYSDSRIGDSALNIVTNHARTLYQRTGILKSFQLMDDGYKSVLIGVAIVIFIFVFAFVSIIVQYIIETIF